jgi:hypothetical protein
MPPITKQYNVKTGDMAIVVKGIAAGRIVEVGKLIPNNTIWMHNNERFLVTEGDSWMCSSKGTPIPFFKVNEARKTTKECALPVIPLPDADLRPLKGLSDDEVKDITVETKKPKNLVHKEA